MLSWFQNCSRHDASHRRERAIDNPAQITQWNGVIMIGHGQRSARAHPSESGGVGVRLELLQTSGTVDNRFGHTAREAESKQEESHTFASASCSLFTSARAATSAFIATTAKC
jgi:hypothetical protein